MRKGLPIVAAVGLLTAALAGHDGVRQLIRGYVAPARAAYVLLAEDPLGSGNFERAAGLIQQARQREAHDAWVYIALAKTTLVYGYRGGGRHRADSYRPAAVDRARRFAERAVERGPEQSFAHAFRARIALMDRDHEAARRGLDRAQALDPDSFYAPFFRSILNRDAGEFEQARRALDRAADRRQRGYQARWLLQARRDVAAAANDRRRTERLHRRMLERFPRSGEARAEYGRFLMREGRYGEAVAQLEKALEVAPRAPVRGALAGARAARAKQDRVTKANTRR